MTPKEFADEMRRITDDEQHKGDPYWDTEQVHIEMDNLMCEVLEDLGYGEGVEIFRNELKWYA